MEKKDRMKKIIRNTIFLLLCGILYGVFAILTGIAVPCMIHLIFKVKCPGCGMTLFMLNCMKGNFAEAIRENYAAPFIVAFILDIYIDSGINYVRKGEFRSGKVNDIIAVVVLVLFVAWGIVRNILGI